MKRFLAFLTAVTAALCLSGCGITFTAKITADESEILSENDIEKAMDAVKGEFSGFDGCVLLELEYDEDFSKRQFKLNAEQYEAEEVIVLRSKFFVGKKMEGSLEKGEVAKWSWILVRDKGGSWKIADAGYC